MNTEFTIHTKAFGALTIPHLQTPPSDFNLITHGGTASLTAYVPDSSVRDNLLEYQRHAGSYTINDTLNNTRRYRETIPGNTAVESLLIGIEPNSELKAAGVRGFYGLVRSISDARTPAFTNPAVNLEVDVAAGYSEYSSLSVAEDALELSFTTNSGGSTSTASAQLGSGELGSMQLGNS